MNDCHLWRVWASIGKEDMSLDLSKSSFTPLPGAVRRWRGLAESSPRTCWVGFGKLGEHCWLGCWRGNWKRMSTEPALGIFQESLVLFMALGESMCQENKSEEAKPNLTEYICQTGGMVAGPWSQGEWKLRTGSSPYCGCGWPEMEAWAESQETWIPVWAQKSPLSISLDWGPSLWSICLLPSQHECSLNEEASLSWVSMWRTLEHHRSYMAERSPKMLKTATSEPKDIIKE